MGRGIERACWRAIERERETDRQIEGKEERERERKRKEERGGSELIALLVSHHFDCGCTKLE